MKALKTSLQELREIFDRSFSVRDIAEPLASFDSVQPAIRIREYLEQMDFDVVGVREDGVIKAFARKQDLSEGEIGDYLVQFSGANILPERTPLLHVFKVLRHCPQVFVILRDQVWGIVTRGDLQKAPVRMWLFGLISLLEMNFLRLIRLQYPDDSWKSLLKPTRLKHTQDILSDRRRRNEAIDLADCLEFGDKGRIVAHTAAMRSALGVSSEEQMNQFLKKQENLRNELAHSQDIITGNWPEICDLADAAEDLLVKCEKADKGLSGKKRVSCSFEKEIM